MAVRHTQQRNACFIYLLLSLGVVALTACQVKPVQGIAVEQHIQAAVVYLKREYAHNLSLLRESPETAAHVYWLVNDNWLAANALYAVAEREWAADLCAAITRYGPFEHGMIEALAGEEIAWPPRVPVEVTVAPGIKREQRSGDVMYDWDDYTDLALYRALSLYHAGKRRQSHRLYREAMDKFDGRGFRDKVFGVEHTYTTYKLALAIYVGRRLNEPVDMLLVKALLDQQQQPDGSPAFAGGFIAHYDAQGRPLNDTNTETTAYALLALSSLQTDAEPTFPCQMPASGK